MEACRCPPVASGPMSLKGLVGPHTIGWRYRIGFMAPRVHVLLKAQGTELKTVLVAAAVLVDQQTTPRSHASRCLQAALAERTCSPQIGGCLNQRGPRNQRGPTFRFSEVGARLATVEARKSKHDRPPTPKQGRRKIHGRALRSLLICFVEEFLSAVPCRPARPRWPHPEGAGWKPLSGTICR